MQIKNIRLKNIRSFENGDIEFPAGRTLLSGDIGSGKSTLLLALEFALFGLQTGFISGNDLLRKGSEEGEVEIDIEIGEKNIKILRSLKRKKTSVAQDKGFIEIDGKQEQLSPEEIKSKVLEFMNYPQSLLKSKSNLLYRFTVYTPQEQMKEILLERNEERIDTLRRIFDIDRYKNIVSNLETFSSKIKEKIKVLEALTEDLEDIKQEIETTLKQMDQEKQNLEKFQPILKALQEEINKKEDIISNLEEKVKTINQIKTENAYLTAENISTERHLSDIKKQILGVKETEINEKIENKNFKEEIEKINKQLEELSIKTQDILSKRIQNEVKKKEILENKEKIFSLSVCPTCKQQVSQDYKEKLAEEAQQKLEIIQKNMESIIQQDKEIQNNIEQIKKILDSSRDEEKRYEILKEKMKFVEEQKKMKQKLSENLEEINKRQEKILKDLKENEEKIKNFLDSEQEYTLMKRDLDSLKEKERTSSIEKAKLEKQLESTTSKILQLKKDLEEKENFLKELQNFKKLNEWSLENFIPLLLKIEKNVMLAVNFEFNKMFGNWFSMLTENLTARIDENFTPIVEQAGYEISYEALSGGERTAAALAYRLSLNQMINSLMSNLSTRGLLILDEPTDGFSSEQLRKMKEILDEIDVKQLLLVSHENEIEDFVEHVLRFKKENNISRIIN